MYAITYKLYVNYYYYTYTMKFISLLLLYLTLCIKYLIVNLFS